LSGVVLTGLGTVGAYGSGCGDLRRALASSEPPVTAEMDRSAGYYRVRGRRGDGGARRALLADPAALREWLSPGEARRMSPPSKLAVAAARMALRCAGLADLQEGQGDERTGVVISTVFGPSSYSEGLLRQILLESPESASPFLFTESVANAPAAQIALAVRARGPGSTICQREAGALIAVGQAATEVAQGRAPRVLAGSVDEMTPLLHSLLDRFGAVVRAKSGGEGGEEVARPFDLRRSGFVAADGATLLVVEPEDEAAARGARPLARVLAWGGGFDPSATSMGWGSGHASLARSLVRTLDRAGLRPADIDLIVSGASGSRGGDRLEGRMLREVWKSELPALPPVLAPKAVTGEYGGGFLAAAVLAATGAPFGVTPGFSEPDPEIGIVPGGPDGPYDGSRLSRSGGTVLVTSVAAGGAASWLVLGTV